jgi:site-specific DNA recombinase
MTTRNVTVIPARKRIGNSAKAEELPKLRVAAYCRVSTDSEEQATSYEAHRLSTTQTTSKAIPNGS